MSLPALHLSLSVALTPPLACDLSGLWRPADGPGLLQFAREGDAMVARVVEPPREDVTLGFAMLYELRYDEDEERYDGYLARSVDQIIDAEVRCVSPDEIEVKGKMGLLRRSFRWLREAAPG